MRLFERRQAIFCALGTLDLVSSVSAQHKNRPSHHHAALAARSNRHHPPTHGAGSSYAAEEWEEALAVRADAPTAARLNNTNNDRLALSVLDAGRFGHSAAYLPSENSILFIGGQIAHEGTFITNDVVTLNLDSGTTSQAPNFARHLPPKAWTASAITPDEEIWLVGGIAEDCAADTAAVYSKPNNATEWISAQPLPAAPKRRKLAHAVVLPNGSTNSSQLYIWGGVSEPYTCSADVEPYTSLDVWQLDTQTVRSTDWSTMFGLSQDWPEQHLPPVTDYVALPLPDSEQVMYIGGRTTAKNGQLLYLSRFNRIALLDTDKLSWSQQEMKYDELPQPREGHAAVYLSDTEVLIQGGVTADGRPVQDHWVLDIVDWSFRAFTTSNQSLPAPDLAWHTITKVSDHEIIVAYGLDPNSGEVSNRIFALSKSDDDGEWSWSLVNGSPISNFVANQAIYAPDAPLASHAMSASGSLASYAANSGISPSAQPSGPSQSRNNNSAKHNGGKERGSERHDPHDRHRGSYVDPNYSTVSMVTPEPSDVADSSSANKYANHFASSAASASSASASHSASGIKVENNHKSSDDQDLDSSAAEPTDSTDPSATGHINKDAINNNKSDSSSKAIAGSVGGVLGAVAALGGLFFLYRRRQGRDTFRVLSVMHRSSGGTANVLQSAPVSVLQYTRPAPKRTLSLGSEPSAEGALQNSAPANMPEMERVQSQASVESYPYLQALQLGDSRSPSIATTPDSPSVGQDPFLSAEERRAVGVARSSSVKSQGSTLLSYLRSPAAGSNDTLIAGEPVNGHVSTRDNDDAATVNRTNSTASSYATTASILESYTGHSPRPDGTAASSSVISPRVGFSDGGVNSGEGATPRIGHQRHESDV